MIVASVGSGLPVIWIAIAALLVVRLAIGLKRRNRRQNAGAPVPSPATSSARRRPPGGRPDVHRWRHPPRGPRAHRRLRVEGRR